jgi:hypothetical protein
MSEIEQDAVLEGEQEVGELPVPSTSGGSTGPGSAKVGSDAEFAKRLEGIEEIVKKLPDIIDSGIKRTKDKRFAALGELDPETLRRFKSYLDKYGGNEDAAIREMRVDAVLEGQSSPPADQGRSDAEERRMTRYVRRTLSGSGVSFNDPEYLALVEKHSSPKGVDEEAFYDDVDELVERRQSKQTKQTNIGAAAAASVPGSAIPATLDADDLAKELNDIQAGRHGSAVSPENKKRRAEIRARLADLK